MEDGDDMFLDDMMELKGDFTTITDDMIDHGEEMARDGKRCRQAGDLEMLKIVKHRRGLLEKS